MISCGANFAGRVTGSGSMRGLAHEVSNAARARMDAGLRIVYFLLDTGNHAPFFRNQLALWLDSFGLRGVFLIRRHSA